ncbi:aminopeptidase P N-terminal domain-containing protein [Denitromonas halophila]|uniref:Xaa-Pro aminopeptidase n=1 Tax=Denitromonas halophila TaxID=1629404 RepID=A0A557QHE1_9RHOO|nr:aminopeptidase P N-terminal domain-containing protein [Denitromonas halophila]TVO52331.1 M24 family metallopeptidase [Denitromonas halophila]
MNPLFAPFHARRQRLLDTLTARGGGVAIIPTAVEVARNRDTHYPFRPDSYFHYLSGFPEPEAVLVLVAGDTPRSLLFCRDKSIEREIWDGFRYGPDAAADEFGFDDAFPVGELDAQLSTLLANQPAVYFALGHDTAWDKRLVDTLNQVREQVRTGITAPASVQDLHAVLDEMRLIKDAHEVLTMRRAAAISDVGHRRAMQVTRPGLHEYEVEAELLHAFRQGGAQSPAYPSIVAGGANACVLHYVSNAGCLADGELLLIDAGCELDGYASDITRTFPVNGRFSGPQRDVYQLVLAAQQAAIDATAPGVGWNAPHDTAVAVLAQGMLDLGLLTGTLDGVLESGDYRRFYMHRTGHWLGLDVHDAGDYKRDGDWRPLREGMTLTVEPGCYIRPADDVPEAFWNIGIRIEDDVLVTTDGCDILSAATPKSIDDIEALMRDARP